MSTDADITLQQLYDEGVEALQALSSQPGMAYEVAPGLVGKMPWPTLADREEFNELGEGINELFREDATQDDFLFWRVQNHGVDPSDPPAEDDLPDAIASALGENPVERLKELGDTAQHPAREGVTISEYNQRTAETNCKRTAALLEFDEAVEPHDIVPEMAAVVVAHFTALRPGRNGSTTS